MTSSWQGEDTIIGLVRSRGTTGDVLHDQRQIGALLLQTELRSSRLPPTSILCIRRMRDPLPGMNWFQHRGVHLPSQWQESAVRALDQFASSAVRPVFHPVSANAESVLFMDRAELLACLAMDWVRGTIRQRWWWTQLLQRQDPELLLNREWSDAIEYAPAAFEILAKLGEASSFLQKQTEETSAGLLEKMRRAFDTTESSRGDNFASAIRAEPEGLHRHRVAEAEPWLRRVPEAADATLSPLKRALLGQALMLRRAPAQARSAGFQVQIERWLANKCDQLPGDVSAEPPNDGRNSGRPAGQFTRPAGRRALGNDPSLDRVESREGDAQPARIPGGIAGAFEDTYGSLADGHDETMPVSNVEIALPDGGFVKESSCEESTRSPRHASEIKHSDATDAREVVDSALGGIFFLLNVALLLQLYGDFSVPRSKGLDLDIWDFLTLIGRALAGDDSHDDPVWKVLERLAGREEGQAAGASFNSLRDWRMPAAWLDPFSDTGRGSVLRGVSGETWAPAEFFSEDEGCNEVGFRSLALQRWVGWIAAYIRARLVRAMDRDDAPDCLIKIPACIVLTATHVHIYYRLDRHPIEVRLAGLDRDPGWIPAAGRYITYHFD